VTMDELLVAVEGNHVIGCACKSCGNTLEVLVYGNGKVDILVTRPGDPTVRINIALGLEEIEKLISYLELAK